MPPIPAVTIQKLQYQTGAIGPSPLGVLAIIAPAGSGPFNTPSAYTVDSQAMATYGPSPLVEETSYTLAVSGNPVIPIRPTTATAALYSAVSKTGTGTSVVTAGAAVPADNYQVLVTIVTGGTIGVAGITYTYSLDGGNSVSAVQALGTANVLTIPNFAAGGSPGVSFALGAGTFVAGDFFRCNTSTAGMTDADLATSLEALRVSALPWEGVLIDQGPTGTGMATTTTGLVDTWLAGLEKVGKFRFAVLNTRMKTQPSETEAAFLTAMTTLTTAAAPSIREVVGTDGGALTSTLTGLTLPRPTSLAIAADAMSIPIGQDPAFVGAGALQGYTIVDGNGNPFFHNEELYQNLDALQLSTLRSVNGQGANAVFITNARVFAQIGSDYVFLPHIRTMNRGCELAYQLLTTQLGKGVGKKPKDPTTGGVYILESDAAVIENLVNGALATPLKGQVSSFLFSLSRTDDISANSGAIINGTLAIVALAYIKGFKVIAAFAKSIAVVL
jgi:hypothetical protein